MAASHIQGTSAVELVLATAGRVSLDQLVAWELARPTDLWRWLEDAGRKGWVAEDAATTAGCFQFRDDARRNEVVAAAGVDDWRWLVARDELVPSILANARRAAADGHLDTASRLFRAVVHLARRDAIPGGSRGWLDVVVECVRLFRAAEWLGAQVLEDALSVAVAHGELRLQAILAARAFVVGRTMPLEDSGEHLERAVEAARAIADRATSFEVHVQLAYGQVLQGRPHEAVATFEQFLGDVPDELVPLPAGLALPSDPLPETPLAMLASVYAQLGQYGRSLDLLHRLCDAGLRAGRTELVALARSNLALLHASRRELEPARACAEFAFDYFAAPHGEPYFLWRTAIALAWVRMAEGRLADARPILAAGQRARRASGVMYFSGSALFEVLDGFDVEGIAAPEDLDIESEIERMLAWRDPYMQAVAHRFRARRLARAAADEQRVAEVDRHHSRSVELLRESRGCPAELARSLEDAAQWAARRGRADDATRLATEAGEVYASVDLNRESGSDASRVAKALVELGRLASLADRADGAWGELAARLCAILGVERCALLEATAGGTRVIAVRGGGAPWVAALEALVALRRPVEPEALEPPATADEPTSAGQLLIVPFASTRLSRRCWAFLENRHSRALVPASNTRVLEALSVQLGVVLENVAMWQELVSARQRLEQENRYYRQGSPASAGGGIVGDSPALREVLALVGRVAPATTAVLVHGETGVGKELVAREIHRLSPRRDQPFIAVHIASLAPGLVASGLFGHERGAFTGATAQVRGRFELADNGTLFLDEVGELGAEDQVRLLRVLQEGVFERVGGTRPIRSDFRLIAATNRDLAAEVSAGRFREDLYFRLAAFPVRVPPLRERAEEIPTLALYFMEAVGRKLAVHFDGISEADMARLVAYRWPGNVRELEHVIERAALLSEPPRLRIPPLHDAFAPEVAAPPAQEWVTLEETERRYLRGLIAHTRGRITGSGGAAELSGLKPSTLSWRIDKLDLRPELRRARAARD